MFSRPLFILLYLCLPLFAQAQPPIEVPNRAMPAEFKWLLLTNDQVRGDVMAAEHLLDLVEPYTTDSILTKLKQRHEFFGAGLGKVLFGMYWEHIDGRKHKLVGTASRPSKVYGGFAKEHDYNFFLIPHLEPYVSMLVSGLNASKEKRPKAKQVRFDEPPFECPEELYEEGRGYFTVECEVTTPKEFRAGLDSLFIPTLKENLPDNHHMPLRTHPNFGDSLPSMGVYGPWCMDCNHSCRPEIHPMDWIWWLDPHQEQNTRPSLMVGLIFDGTTRFEDWSAAPLTGSVAIPFRFPVHKQSHTLEITPLVWGEMDGAALAKIPGTAADGVIRGPGIYRIPLQPEGAEICELNLRVGEGPAEGEFALFLSELGYDSIKDEVFGYLNVAAATRALFTFRYESRP